MSYDFATLKVCSHYIADEQVTLDLETSQYIIIPRKLSNERIKINIDGYEIPASGLHSYAEFTFSKPEPYRIVSGVSDTIQIKILNGAVQSIKLNPGSMLSAKSVADDLSTKIKGLTFTVKNKRVVFSSPTRFKGTYFTFIDPRWTDKALASPTTTNILACYSNLGITPGRCGIGLEVYPSWDLTVNEFDPLEQVVLKFSKPIYNTNPVVTLSYTTLATFCPRCQGSRLEYDYSIVKNTYETVKNSDLLVQEADKFMFTILGSHWKWPWLGSNLLNRIGSKANPDGLAASGLVGIEINQAFATYQNIKSQQATRYLFQNVSDSEFPVKISNMSVGSPDNDPTTVLANFTISSRSRTVVPITRLVSAPDPFQVTSDPSGVIQQAGKGFTLRG